MPGIRGESSVKVKAAQSCLTLCDPTDYTVHGILQARILEWVAFPFSRGSSQPRLAPCCDPSWSKGLQPALLTSCPGPGALELSSWRR